MRRMRSRQSCVETMMAKMEKLDVLSEVHGQVVLK